MGKGWPRTHAIGQNPTGNRWILFSSSVRWLKLNSGSSAKLVYLPHGCWMLSTNVNTTCGKKKTQKWNWEEIQMGKEWPKPCPAEARLWLVTFQLCNQVGHQCTFLQVSTHMQGSPMRYLSHMTSHLVFPCKPKTQATVLTQIDRNLEATEEELRCLRLTSKSK